VLINGSVTQNEDVDDNRNILVHRSVVVYLTECAANEWNAKLLIATTMALRAPYFNK